MRRDFSISLKELRRRSLCVCVLSAGFFAILLSGLEAHAIQFRVTELSGCDDFATTASCLGEVITIGIRVENTDRISIHNVGGSVQGYDTNVVSFVSGSAVESVLNSDCIPGLGCFGGANNFLDSTLFEQEDELGDGPYVRLIEAHAMPRTDHDGRRDAGLDGVIDGSGSQMRVAFRILAAGTTTLNIGFVTGRDGSVLGDFSIWEDPPASVNTHVVLSSDALPRVIPEPTVGVLMGFGLMTLSLRTRTR